jgi:hypothetical protein
MSGISATGSATSGLSTYQTEYNNLQAYDTSELLYASFLSPADGLANADAVLGQAAQLLGTPGSPPASTSSTSNSSTSTSGSSTTSSTAPENLPSVASILAASDASAQQTLTNYAAAPVGSSIIDYQA